MTIDKTFRDLADAEVKEMRHPDPKKRNLRVVEVRSDQAWVYVLTADVRPLARHGDMGEQLHLAQIPGATFGDDYRALCP